MENKRISQNVPDKIVDKIKYLPKGTVANSISVKRERVNNVLNTETDKSLTEA